MYIRRLIYSDIGKYVISILLGLGIATLFRRACKDRSCLVFRGASINKVKDQIFKFGDKCYIFTPEIGKCHESKQTLDFA